MKNERYKYVLKGAKKQLEIKTRPVLREGVGIVEFSGEATEFLYDAYKAEGVVADVKLICLKKKFRTNEWEEDYIKRLDLCFWSIESGLFTVRYGHAPLN